MLIQGLLSCTRLKMWIWDFRTCWGMWHRSQSPHALKMPCNLTLFETTDWPVSVNPPSCPSWSVTAINSVTKPIVLPWQKSSYVLHVWIWPGCNTSVQMYHQPPWSWRNYLSNVHCQFLVTVTGKHGTSVSNSEIEHILTFAWLLQFQCLL